MTQPTPPPQAAARPPAARSRRPGRAAAALTVAGVVGLGLVALPGGAGAAPELPPVTPEDLVASVLTATPQALSGTVELDNALGLPALAGAPQLAGGTSTARIWTDGVARGRVQLPSPDGERTLVADGTTFWAWDSTDRSVVRLPLDGAADGVAPGPPADVDPASVAGEALAVLQPTSRIAVDGTAEVAGRAAYELVLTPLPTERTLLREVRMAVDAEHRMPLRLSVLATGSDEPALEIGFTDLDFGAPDPELLTFTPPPGAEVTDVTKDDLPRRGGDGPTTPGDLPTAPGAGAPTLLGDGWDTVVLADTGRAITANPEVSGSGPARGPFRGDAAAEQGLPDLASLGRPVSGPWGSGTLISTAVVTAIVADDGRVAAGAVPEQVLVEALSR